MSSLFRRAEQNEDIIDNLRVHPLLLGDGGYPLCKWLMKPYSFTPALNNIEKKFNKKLSSSRAVVERSFGICKARSRWLLKRLDNKVELFWMLLLPVLHYISFARLTVKLTLTRIVYLRI